MTHKNYHAPFLLSCKIGQIVEAFTKTNNNNSTIRVAIVVLLGQQRITPTAAHLLSITAGAAHLLRVRRANLYGVLSLSVVDDNSDNSGMRDGGRDEQGARILRPVSAARYTQNTTLQTIVVIGRKRATVSKRNLTDII